MPTLHKFSGRVAWPRMRTPGLAALLCCCCAVATAQTMTPELLEAAARRTGLSTQELERRYREADLDTTAGGVPPGREGLDGIDDSRPVTATEAQARWRDTDVQVVLPGGGAAATATAAADSGGVSAGPAWFGTDFFGLDAGVFSPPSFGPVPGEYRLGVGDEIVVNVWGELEFQLTRVVDRDGAIILPEAGKILAAGRTLDEVDGDIRRRLARRHADIDEDGAGNADEGGTTVEVTLGRLRSIRVFVVGNAVRPGSYELSSVSTVLTALYAAGGPQPDGSLRDIRLMRGSAIVGTLDLYDYLLAGDRGADLMLREGDTVYVPDRGPGVTLVGEVRRPLRFETRPGEGVADVLLFAGGVTASAAPEIIHVERILPPADRRPGRPDMVVLDLALDPATLRPLAEDLELLDGDVLTVPAIGDRLGDWVEVRGGVKRPGRFQHRPDLTVADLVALAGGLWPDALTERALIDRTSAAGDYTAVAVVLGDTLASAAAQVRVQVRDVLHVFSRWDVQERPQVHIAGEVHEPLNVDFREGMTLRDLILLAGGPRTGADLLRAEISRLRLDAMNSRDTTARPARTVEIVQVDLGGDFLAAATSPALSPWDRVVVRRLPWWELQRTVTVRGEVYYPGVFSLERSDETLTSLLARAGGLKPDAYVIGARVERSHDSVGNIAIDLARALETPGSQHDIILQDGDVIIVPERMHTVKIQGEVGFPTSLVHEDGRSIDWYVGRAGGYLEKADKGKTRVVYPNGMSLPNKGGSKVVAGSTIVVPREPPPEGRSSLEVAKDITAIVAGLATVWLIVDSTRN